ncbi:unnamed protein product, partial [Mesorhabditis belari]|uniref:SET domain-containing protein n=1 Tax=Mesorhabditis belari TaxID=2138241 RepID=A0AAF3FMK1_9BILA
MADSQMDNGQAPENVNNQDENVMSAENFDVPTEAQEVQVPEARQMAMIDDDEEGEANGEQSQAAAIEIPMEVMDHDYYTFDASQRSNNADSQEFPEIPPLDIFDNSSGQEMDVSRAEKPFFESPPSTFGSRGQPVIAGGSGGAYRNAPDSRRLLIGGQQFAYSNSQRLYQQTQRSSEYASPSYVATPGYQNSGVASIRRIQPVQSTAGTPAQMNVRKSLPAQRASTTPMNKTMTRVMPPPIPQAEPPHRALLTGKQTSTMSPGLAYQAQVLTPQADDSIAAPRGGAPLLVAGRGAKPVIRGRAGTVRRKDGDGEDAYDEHLARGSPRKVNFIDGIAPGGTTITSPSGTVNLVVGAPPHGSMHMYDRSLEHSFQDADAAVQQNLHAIQQSMDEQRDPRSHQMVQHREPLPISYMSKLNDGECSFRTLAYTDTVKLKNTFPDVPVDPVPEPRPRGRPRGSTNRTRLSSQSGASPAAPITPVDNSSPRRVTGKSPPMKPSGSKSPVKGSFVMVEEIEQMPPLVPPQLPTLVSNIAPQFEPKKEQKPQPLIANGFKAETPVLPPAPSPVPSEDSDTDSDYSHTTAEEEWGDYVTRCWCELNHNDENMIQCEKCDAWQHMKCMGIPYTKPPEKYLCERCDPRKLKLNKEQAREYQERKQAELLKETTKRRADRKKRNEEHKKAKETRKAQKRAEHAKNRIKRNEAMRPVSGLQFRKYTDIKENEYSDRAKKLLQRFASTQGAAHVVQNVRSAEQKYGRMFVAPSLEGLVAIKDIPKNDLVIEYLGFVSTPSECPGREKEGYVQPHCVLYSGVAPDCPLVIDARRKGGDSRTVRRSCRPNTVLKHVVLDGHIHVLLNATEPIEKSAEITIPFDSDYQKCPRALACACGDEACCPIADFNARIIARSPTPTPKRKLSTGAVSAKKATPSSSKATPASAKKGGKKSQKGAKPQGRQPMIKLRRHDTKEAREPKEEAELSEENDDEQGVIQDNRATRAARRSELQPASTETPPAENASERRETRRQKKESEGELKEPIQETTSPRGRGRGKAVKEETTEASVESEEEPKPRTTRKSLMDNQVKSEPKSPVKPASRSRSRIEQAATPATDTSKMTREERKLQKEMEIFEKMAKDMGTKSKSPAKEIAIEKRNRRGSEKSSITPLTPTRERLRDRTVKASPQKDNTEKEPTRSQIASPAVVPLKKRWQMEQKQREEEEAAATIITPTVPDFSQGKKAFLLRRAQADREKEEPAPPDPAPSSPQALPNFTQPLKKRRHVEMDVSQTSVGDQISHPYMSPNASSSKASPSKQGNEPSLRELLKEFARGLAYQPAINYEIKEGPNWPAVTEIKRKKLSLEEYKRRRTGPITPSTSTDVEPPARVAGKKSFIPNIHDSDNAPAHLAPVPDPRSLSTDSALTFDELKKRVYGQTFMTESTSESRLEPPPPPPVLRSPMKSPPRAAPPTDAIGSPQESTPRAMSVADRLRMQFGHLMQP